MKKANHNAGGEAKPPEEMNAEQQTGGPEAVTEDMRQADVAVDVTEEAARKYDELNDRFLRLYAEYDNYRKRTSKEKESIYSDCVVQVTAEWLPVVDNLMRAIESASQYEKEIDRSVVEGIELVLRQAESCLERLGVEPIEAVGNPFNPLFHEAVMQVEQEGAEPGTVVEEFKKGYRRGDRVIRHSMVKVAN